METNSAAMLAEIIAVQAHAGQIDKSGYPYIGHCNRVADRVIGDTEKAIAWLHDTLEDTTVTEQDLRACFSTVIVDAVVALTHPRNEPNTIYWARVKANELARYVKLADIEDNLDPIRLQNLDAETVSRLVAKYEKARMVLNGND